MPERSTCRDDKRLGISSVSASDERQRPHRPVPLADLTALIDAAGGSSDLSRAEIASATAAAVVSAGRGGQSDRRFVELADRVGLDTLAALWRDCDPVSLPGALWVLYVLRQWCHGHADDVSRLWRSGAPYAPADAVVAGVAEDIGDSAVRRFADAVLDGAYQGQLDVALERAAAFFRVIASGRRERLDVPAAGTAGAQGDACLAERNERTADGLAAAAARWRAGTLH